LIARWPRGEVKQAIKLALSEYQAFLMCLVMLEIGSERGTNMLISTSSVVLPQRFSGLVMASRGETSKASKAWAY
jgi:hypothetical protein